LDVDAVFIFIVVFVGNRFLDRFLVATLSGTLTRLSTTTSSNPRVSCSSSMVSGASNASSHALRMAGSSCISRASISFAARRLATCLRT
jgi:hypothetical protein